MWKFEEKPNLGIVETENKEYNRKLIEYNVNKNERVKSDLLIPKQNKNIYPAILAMHPQTGN